MFVCFWNSRFFFKVIYIFFSSTGLVLRDVMDWIAFVLLLFSFLSNQMDGFMGFYALSVLLWL